MTTLHVEMCKSIKLVTYQQIMLYLTNCTMYDDEQSKMMRDILFEMKQKGQNQLKLSNSFFVPLLVIYGIMIVFGGIGSFLVILIVAKKRVMRTPRNLFILNLAISDLILCSFTEPFNLLRLLSGHQEWNLGETICKLTSMLQGTNILVSTFSISAIALDRFQIIVHPEKDPISNKGVVRILFLIWCLAIILSFPLYFFSTVHQDHPKKCFEVSESETLKPFRFAHSYLMLVLQYVVPMVIVSVTYLKICMRIKYRMVNQRFKNNEPVGSACISQVREKRRQKESRRQRRTNILLSCLAIIFALSWLPLNIVNLVMDSRQNSFDERKDLGQKNSSVSKIGESVIDMSENMTLSKSVVSEVQAKYVLSTQAVCLLIVLCSACANPVLYGWLNENFKREFRNMFKSIFPFLYSDTRPIELSQLIQTNNNSVFIDSKLGKAEERVLKTSIKNMIDNETPAILEKGEF